jgi:hypothetical protein
MINRVFDQCARLLESLAWKLGMTYEQVNVALFCIFVPAINVGQTAAILYLLRK